MLSDSKGLRRLGSWLWLLAGAWLLSLPVHAETNVVLHLKSGDRIAGTIVSEDTNRVVIATSWIKELPVPLSAIEWREAGPPSPAAVALQAAKSNVVAVLTTAPPTTKPPEPKRWKVDVTMGTDLLFGAVDRQLYYSRLKLTYEQPYKSNPKKFFRSLVDYTVDYGRTEGVESANRMGGSIKTDFDVGRRVYLYNLAGAGYDEIRQIDLYYEIGPGVGYHLFTLPKFVMNVESGVNYQAQQRHDSRDVESFYLRLAEDVTWKITPRVTLTEKFEFYPNIENTDQFRARFDATLSFGLWRNLTLKLTVLDLYDTNPARNADNNELQIRSALGITF